MKRSSEERPYLVFIPTYNDFGEIPRLLSEIAALEGDHQVLIVDDGSKMQLEFPMPPNVLYCRLPENQGIGVCLRIAIQHALRHGYRALVRVDADGQHSISDIPRLTACYQETDSAIVCAKRIKQGCGGLLSRFVRNAVKKYFSLIAYVVTFGKSPSDVNTGMFLLGRRALAKLADWRFGRFPEPQLFIQSIRNGLRIEEVVVEQKPRGDGKSSVTVFAALRLVYRFNAFVFSELLGGSKCYR